MQIAFNKQMVKYESSIRVMCDFFLNVIDSSFERAKQKFPKFSALQRMQIHFNEHFDKHNSSIRINCDSSSNVIDSINE
jgi:hypothetical protein